MPIPRVGEIRRAYEIGYSEKRGHHQKYIWVACPKCGKQRWVQSRKNATSKLCRSCARGSEVGEKSHNWKGGRFKTPAGYIMVYAPEHSRARYGKPYIFEHILVWETYHNRKLPTGWVVHHVNGIKSDNRPRNLLGLPKGEHHSQLLNQTLKQRIRELEVENKLLEKALESNQMILRIEEN